MEAYTQSLISQLRYFAFASIVLACMVDYFIYRDVHFGKRLVYLCVLIAGIAFYDQIIETGTSLFEAAKESSREEVSNMFSNVNTSLKEYAAKAGWWERKVTIPLASGCLWFARLFEWLSSFVQVMLITVFRCCAPIVFGLAAWRVFISVGIRFAVGTLWVCMWSIGTAIADILLVKILAAALGKGVISGGASAAGTAAASVIGGSAVAVGPAVLVGLITLLIIFIISAIVFYTLIPIMMYSILSGGEVVHAATHAMQGAVGAGGAAMGMTKVAAREAQQGYTSAKTVIDTIKTQTSAAEPTKTAASSSYELMANVADKQLSGKKGA